MNKWLFLKKLSLIGFIFSIFLWITCLICFWFSDSSVAMICMWINTLCIVGWGLIHGRILRQCTNLKIRDIEKEKKED